ncbi:hypothetical protein MIMGU_mgv1a0022072mg, partial [Erythranthe guttata]
MLSSPLAK